ncbi:hypothetical protein PN836_005030 [Ningiella sp. W23]|uniref:hypothetical protein n=1 Tax=Ningiella sp. W23 TaxID=3023715 RepID=UPI0037565FB4
MKLENVCLAKYSVIALFMMITTACVSTAPNPDNEYGLAHSQNPKTLSETSQIRAEENLTPSERMSKALQSLDRGESALAKVELTEYLKAAPGNSRAHNLLRQINTASKDYYPEEFFTVELKSGQSLSTLAKRYLGSAWEFYALAKYNDIEQPRRVIIGSEIKIPLTQLAELVLAKEKEAEARETEVAESEQLIAGKSLIPEKALDTKLPDVLEPQISFEPALAQTPIAQLSPAELLSQLHDTKRLGEFEKSRKLLEAYTEKQGMTDELKPLAIEVYQGQANQLESSDPVKAAEAFVKLGQLQLTFEDELQAFESFKAAAQADENNSLAKSLLQQTRSDISQKYHRQASVFYRQQALDDAIAKWDVVLSVDPGHSNAQAYRILAIDLKKRMEALQN